MKKSVLIFVLFCAMAGSLYAQTIPGIIYEPVNVTNDEILRAIHEMGQYSASQRGSVGNDTLWEPVLSHTTASGQLPLILKNAPPFGGYITGTAMWDIGLGPMAGPILTAQKFNYSGSTSVTEVITWIGKRIIVGSGDSIRAFVYQLDQAVTMDSFAVTLLGVSDKKCTCDLIPSLSSFPKSSFQFSVPVPVSDSFFVAIEYDDNSTFNPDVLDDTLVIVTNYPGDGTPGSGSGQNERRAAQYHPIVSSSKFYNLEWLAPDVLDIDAYIFPVITGASGIENEKVSQNFSLLDAFPNPLNATAVHIGYDLGKSGDVEISLYNMMGQEVKSIKEQNVPAGRHFVSVDLSDLSAGLYVYQIRSGDFSASKKLNLVK